MKASFALVMAGLAAFAVSQQSCNTPNGSGTCMYTNTTCSGTYISGACPGGKNYQCCVAGASGGSLPGLDSTQSANARAVIQQNDQSGYGQQGCLAGITTGLTESNMRVLANSNVPSSLNYPHDGVGHDHDSLGIFQQRVKYYPNEAADMDPAQSAAQFFAQMVKISGWQTMDVPTLCQEVQKSAVPDAYAKHFSAAQSICSAAGD